jgi:hypothetical protein
MLRGREKYPIAHVTAILNVGRVILKSLAASAYDVVSDD